MKTFSQRKGLKPVSETIQVDSMNSELRVSLWNVLDVVLWSTEDYMHRQYGEPYIESFSKMLWFHHFKKPVDSRPDYPRQILELIRKYFFSCEWNEVYDLLEFTVCWHRDVRPMLSPCLNDILERELSGYRFVSNQLVDITDAEELKMLDAAVGDSQFSGPSAHLACALDHYASREKPDYRNSIKESISAVESMARIVAESPKATLSDALKVLEKSKRLHPALKDGFIKLYAYTSDESGIRHAMLDEPNLTASDARYFLLSCTSFVNYLKAQLA